MFSRVLVPIDGSDCAHAGLLHAIDLAKACNASLHLLHIMDAIPPGSEWASAQAWHEVVAGLEQRSRALLERSHALAQAQGVDGQTACIEFPARRVADVIVEQAAQQGCDCIVMGSHGRRGFNRLMLGSDAELVLRLAQVPVLVVPHAEHQV
jgi:nucleotide-binding universal stress UspA family protein